MTPPLKIIWHGQEVAGAVELVKITTPFRLGRDGG
jgi:hypothetical protein